jgi:hypothetical protein
LDKPKLTIEGSDNSRNNAGSTNKSNASSSPKCGGL